jgi:HEAT repeat protein
MQRSPQCLTWITVAILACTVGAGAQQKSSKDQAELAPLSQPFEVALDWQMGRLGAYAMQTLKCTEQAPEGVDLPSSVSKEPHYFSIPYGKDQKLHGVVSFAYGRPKIILDRECNDDLSDNDDSGWEKNNAGWRCSEDVFLKYEEQAEPVAVHLEFTCSMENPVGTLRYIADIHKTGEILLGERMRKIALRDEASNLDWSAPNGVVLLLDANGDGTLESAHGTPDHFHSGDRIQIGSQAWRYEVQGHDGASVKFLPVDAIQVDLEAQIPQWKVRNPRLPAAEVEVSEIPLSDLLGRYQRDLRQPYSERVQNVFEIGSVGTNEAFQALLKISKLDTDKNIQRVALRALSNPKFAACEVQELAGIAMGIDPQLARIAMSSLFGMQHPDLEELLLQLIKSADFGVASSAAQYLGALNGPLAEKKLGRLLDDDNIRIREMAYAGLRNITQGPSHQAMLAAAGDSNPQLMVKGLQDLLAMGHPEVRALTLEATERGATAYPQLTKALLGILTIFGDQEAITAGVDFCKGNDRLNVDKQVVEHFASLRSDEAQEAFFDLLKDKSAWRRQMAARILQRIGADTCIEPMLKQLKREKDDRIAEIILETLGQNGGADAVEQLIEEAQRRGHHRLSAISALAQAGKRNADARQFLLELLTSKHWEDHVLAIDAIGELGELKLTIKLAANLDHEQWQVRLATVEALRKVRHADWVAPLVAHLQIEERLRVQKAIGLTLFQLTGQNPYMDAAAWQRWWTAVESEFVMPVKIPQPHRSGDTISKQGFYGLTLDSDSVVFVIDKSGSMSAGAPADDTMDTPGTRLDQALNNASRAVELLDDHAIVNVVMFSSGVRTWKKNPVELKKKNRKDLYEFLNSQRPDGGTDLFDGLEKALLQDGVDRIMLLSDGAPGGGRFVTTPDILREVRRLNQTKRIAIDCVSLGMRSDLLRRLAEENGGRYIER